MPTSTGSRHTRAFSPPLSTAGSSQAFTAHTLSQQSKLNVVTRLAIEGHAKQGEDGSSIKMYLKITLPLDTVSPGSTVPLFPEENVKILTSQVHPLDNNSVPYNFSSITCPLLHNAARALNLPARSTQSYLSVFGISASSSSVRSSSARSGSSSNGVHVPALDDKYTGHILVSGYNVSYVLPKEFPPRFNPTFDDGDSVSRPSLSFRSRRSSVSDRNSLQLMAAIDLWVPYISRPPRAPYLVSIPVPRCLSNHVKLRIFPPVTTSASFASLSSAEEDGGTWDLTSDPHVTRNASIRPSRTNSYTHFADDESSDSSSTKGFLEGCGIQGTFPSAERLRVRWASPIKSVDIPGTGDGRRRVGVREVKGEMVCVIVGKGKDKAQGGEGVQMNVEYKGTCKGVWFPGVATLLGMDVGLESKGSDVAWVSGVEPKWTVGGGSGYTGFDMGQQHKSTPRQTTIDIPQVNVSSSSPESRPGPTELSSRQNSTSSTSSLLRAPLPSQNVEEYSFEGSQVSSALSGTVSSLSSLPPSSPNDEGLSRMPSLNNISDPQDSPRPPAVPITIHINMNDLLPPSKNVFTFTISGTILITPRARINGVGRSSHSLYSDSEVDPEPIVLPRFSVLAADDETVSTIIRNEADGTTLEVYNSSGDIRDAQTRKTVLQKGGLTRCGSDGGRIALRSLRPAPRREESTPPPSRPRTPIGLGTNRTSSASISMKQAYSMLSTKPKRDGPLMIPCVTITVMPLIIGDVALPDAYAVCACLPAPADADSEWLEFGLAQPGPSTSASTDDGSGLKPPRVEVASASVDGVPVLFEATVAAKPEVNLNCSDKLGVPFEEMSGKEWVSWIRVHVGEANGGNVVLEYVVKEDKSEDGDSKKARKKRAKEKARLNVFLPTFLLPVGKLEVNVHSPLGFDLASMRSNLAHQQATPSGRTLLHYSLPELYYPRLEVYLRCHAQPSLLNFLAKVLRLFASILPAIISMILLFWFLGLGAEVRSMRRSWETCSAVIGSRWDEPDTVTVTTTLFTSSGRWWQAEPSSTVYTEPVQIPSITSSPIVSSPTSPLKSAHADSTSIPPSIPIPTPQQSLTPESESEDSEDSLTPYLPFNWTSFFDMELSPSTRKTVDLVLHGLGKVWQVFRKAYHYPP